MEIQPLSRLEIGAGCLYIIATPIGNLEDITLRGLRHLKTADAVVAEDTRRTRQLLAHFGISKPLISYYKEVERTKTTELLSRLEQGQALALVSDAGTPGISDPGAYLVQAARKKKFRIEVVPGASAVMALLAGCGFPEAGFSFHGFLANRTGLRRKFLHSIKDRAETQVFFVAPHSLLGTLADIRQEWSDRQAVLGRELTKKFEEFIVGNLSEIETTMQRREIRGEFALAVAGVDSERLEMPQAIPVSQALEELQQAGLSRNQAVARVSRERKLSRRQVYALAHGLKLPFRQP